MLAVIASTSFTSDDWTWNYRRKIAVSEAKALAAKGKHFVFVKEGTPAFTQLIFSWNAHRPQQGHYSFFVQSRDALTRRWTKKWIRMADWGKNIQRSHLYKDNQDVNYVYVRLEELSGNKADAFKVKVECSDGATLEGLRLLNVCISNMLNFAHEQLANLKDLKFVEIKGIPKISQFELGHEKQNAMCSPTSLTMLISYLLKKNINPLEVAEGCYDYGLEAYGSWPFNVAHAFERCYNTNNFKVRRLPSFRDLHGSLARGLPVVVSIRGFLKSAPQDYPNGHLILVAGFNSENGTVICHDPAFSVEDVRHEYDLGEFIRAWERSNRLAYVVEAIK